ncbi:MAG TPA: carbon-phosphorus lyase complex subunit PhnI [Vicinamibacterales bacterium]|nr:carbon-phosphorus lyase complex subunit PhnI [Vicinamibacterales bacterium]
MGYVAVKGGQDAITNAADLVEYYRWREEPHPIAQGQFRPQFRLLIDKVMGEGSLYAPEHAALALQQVEGDVFEAAFILRAYRATLQRRYYSETINTREMFVQRRISSAFREIPGGQILGPTRDYTQRLLNPAQAHLALGSIETFLDGFKGRLDPDRLHGVTTFGKVIDLLMAEGVMRRDMYPNEDRRVVDITREAIKFPAPRSARLQMLARAETGGLMCLGYSSMRGYGEKHGTVGELRVGDVPVRLADPRGRRRYLGKIKVTETEMIGRSPVKKKGRVPFLSVGYGLCFGQNETKGICMGMLDSALRVPNNQNPANNQEFVLYHTECVEAYGFTNHLKLPHYVTFQAGLQNLRDAVQRAERKPERAAAEMAVAAPAVAPRS